MTGELTIRAAYIDPSARPTEAVGVDMDEHGARRIMRLTSR